MTAPVWSAPLRVEQRPGGNLALVPDYAASRAYARQIEAAARAADNRRGIIASIVLGLIPAIVAGLKNRRSS